MVGHFIRKWIPVPLDYSRVVFFLSDLMIESIPRQKDGQSFGTHIISSRNDPWLKVLCKMFPEKYFHLRMSDESQRCYVTIVRGDLVAYAWITTSFCHVSEVNFNLIVGEGCLYIYDCYVETASRRQGLYSSLLLQILLDYKGINSPVRYHTACIGAEPGNKASTTAIKRIGFKKLTCVRYLRCGKIFHWHGAAPLITSMGSET